MKRWLIALLLLAGIILAPETAEAVNNRWVSPTGVATWANATSSSTPASLATANANVGPDDRVHMLPGTYTGNLAPLSGGSVTNPVVFMGAAGDSAGVVIQGNIALPSGANYITVKWMKCTGNFNCEANSSSPLTTYPIGDSLYYVRVMGGFGASGSQSLTVSDCLLGVGNAPGNGLGFNLAEVGARGALNATIKNVVAHYGGWSPGANGLGGGNYAFHGYFSFSTFTNSKFYAYIGEPTDQASPVMLFHSKWNTFTDCKWSLKNTSLDPDRYVFGMRDSSSHNYFLRDSFVTDPNSTNTTELRFSVSGTPAFLNAGSQYGTTFDRCYFQPTGLCDIQAYMRRLTIRNSIFNLSGPLTFNDLSSTNGYDSLLFEHNTIYSRGGRAIDQSNSGSIGNPLVRYNIFMLTGSAQLVAHEHSTGTRLWDYNLFYSGNPADSINKWVYNGANTVKAGPSAAWCTTSGQECHSRWGNPLLNDVGSGSFQPAANSPAFGDWWGAGSGGYVGALPPAGAPPADSCLDATRPGRVADLVVARDPAASDQATFTLTFPGETQFTGDGASTSFEIRRAATPITTIAEWNAATYVFDEAVASYGTPGVSGSFAQAGLPTGTTWYAFRFLNTVSGLYSCLSNSDSAYLPPADASPPSQVTNLSAKAVTPDSVLLIFSAPTDASADIAEQAVTSYSVRFRFKDPLTPTRWDAVTTLTAPDISYSPKAPGSTDTIVVYNLPPDKIYWFAIKSSDALNNVSLMSNSDSAWTPPMTEPTTGYPRWAIYGGAGSAPYSQASPMVKNDSMTVDQTTYTRLTYHPVISFNPGMSGIDSSEAVVRKLEANRPDILRLAEPVPNPVYIQRYAYAPGDTSGLRAAGLTPDRDGVFYRIVEDSVGPKKFKYNPQHLYYMRAFNAAARMLGGWTPYSGWSGTGTIPSDISTEGSVGLLWQRSANKQGYYIGTNPENVAGSTLANTNWGGKQNGRYTYPDSMRAIFQHMYFDRTFQTVSGGSSRWFHGLHMDLADPSSELFSDVDYERAGFARRGALDSAYTEAHVQFMRDLRRMAGRNWYLSGNGGIGTVYGDYANGYMREFWPTQNGGSWFTNFWWYTTGLGGQGGQVADWHRFKYKPSMHWIFAVPPACSSSFNCGAAVKDTAAAVEAKLRYVLGTAALTGARAVYEPTQASLALDYGTNPANTFLNYWFDEYAVKASTGTAEKNTAYTGWLGAPQDTFYQKIGTLTTTDVMASDGPGFETADSSKWTRTMSGNFGRVTTTTSTVHGGSRALVAYVYNDTTIRPPSSYTVQAVSNKVFVVKSGQTWSVRFWAKADFPRPLEILLFRPSTGATVQDLNSQYHLCRPWLTQTWKQYSWPINVTTADSTSQGVAVKVAFWFADTTGTVWIDDVQCQQGKKDTYIRDFANGVVLVNEDAGQDTVTFGRATRNIYARTGNAPDVTNDGYLIPAATNIFVPGTGAKFLLWATDSIRPAPVSTLSATAITGGIRLIWTSPGSDSLTGQAASYDIRMRLNQASFVEANWASAIPLTGFAAPKTAGAADTFVVDADQYGITPGLPVAFALKTTDSFRQQSAISNAATTTPASVDTAPPSPVNISTIAKAGRIQVTITFTQPGDNGGGGGDAHHYIVKRASSTIGTEAAWSAATTVVASSPATTAGTSKSIVFTVGLRGTWYVAVRAVDTAGNISQFGTNKNFIVTRRRGGYLDISLGLQ